LSVPSRIFRAGKPGWNRGRQNSRPEDIFFDECVTSGGEFFDKNYYIVKLLNTIFIIVINNNLTIQQFNN